MRATLETQTRRKSHYPWTKTRVAGQSPSAIYYGLIYWVVVVGTLSFKVALFERGLIPTLFTHTSHLWRSNYQKMRPSGHCTGEKPVFPSIIQSVRQIRIRGRSIIRVLVAGVEELLKTYEQVHL